jgi:hypothetical protein
VEKWLNVTYPAFSALYQVSSLGNVRRLIRGEWRALGGTVQRGYRWAYLSAGKQKLRVKFCRLVALAFLGESSLTVNHKDGTKWNDSVENLEWMTFLENTAHATEMGLQERGESRYNHKLTEERVRFLRLLRMWGYSTSELGRRFGVSSTCAYNVVMRRAWAHVS